MTALQPKRFGKYELLALLATGGMAEIWLARVHGAAGFEKLVVIKRLLDRLAVDPEYVRMFLDEARINARLSHSNVVQVLELGQVENKYFMAMEYVMGMSIAALGKKATQRLGEVPQAVACGVVAQTCAGLHYAHERSLPDGTPLNIIHRDISPQNLICTWEGLVKVVDFGIAKSADRETETRAGLVKGKFSYMSPEQCLGQPLDRRSDVFALGIILFELCTARRLFKRGKTYHTYEAITKADVPSPRSLNPKVDRAVEAVIFRALSKRPEDRFPSAEAMQEAIELAMHKAGLRGSRTDLEKFVLSTFDAEHNEQQELLSKVQRGEADKEALHVSPVAENAAAEAEAKDSGRIDLRGRTGTPDLLPGALAGLADDSKPTKVPEARDDFDDGPTQFDPDTDRRQADTHRDFSSRTNLPPVDYRRNLDSHQRLVTTDEVKTSLEVPVVYYFLVSLFMAALGAGLIGYIVRH